MEQDTIAAIATGVEGSIAILRVSGRDAEAICARLWRGKRPLPELPARAMTLGHLVADGGRADRCLAVRFPGPHSYTGESMVELHCHGGPLVARTALGWLLTNGARHAEPGEFTRRAFINGKLDLTQAEAVLDVIQAGSTMALHAANRQLDGLLGRRVDALYELLTELLAEVESRLDFADEHLDFEPAAALLARLDQADAAIDVLLASRQAGEILRQGIRLVIAGIPNAGKSSLLNLILGRDRAIVTPVPGTTRDTLEEHAQIRGIPLRLVDTAGLREADDEVERHGVARSFASLDGAQVVVWLIDLTRDPAEQPPPLERLAGKPLVIAANKRDLAPGVELRLAIEAPVVYLSAQTGEGVEALYDAVERLVWGRSHASEPEVAINARHAALLSETRRQLAEARTVANHEEYEMMAVNLRSALDALGRITGRTAQPDILDTIFSKFCIGK